MKKFILSFILLFMAFVLPATSQARVIPGMASIKHKPGGGTLTCTGSIDVCAIVNGNEIIINHWSGQIRGTLGIVLPMVIPDGFPIDFDSEDEFPED